MPQPAESTFGQGQVISRGDRLRRERARKRQLAGDTNYTAEELRAIQAAMREAVLARLGIRVGR